MYEPSPLAQIIFLGLGNILFLFHILWEFVVWYRKPTTQTKARNTRSLGSYLSTLSWILKITVFVIGTLSTLSIVLGTNSDESCYWILKGVSCFYVLSKLWLYLFLLVRGRVVQSALPKNTKSKSAYLERIVIWLTLLGVPAFLVVIAILAHGERVLEAAVFVLPGHVSFQCTFVVPYNLALVMLGVDVLLSSSFVLIFTLALKEADASMQVFTPGTVVSEGRKGLYQKLMKKHLRSTYIAICVSICSMTFLGLGAFIPEVRPFILPIGITDIGVNMLIVHTMMKKGSNTSSDINSTVTVSKPPKSRFTQTARVASLSTIPPTPKTGPDVPLTPNEQKRPPITINRYVSVVESIPENDRQLSQPETVGPSNLSPLFIPHSEGEIVFGQEALEEV
jgi:hypothetical protein